MIVVTKDCVCQMDNVNVLNRILEHTVKIYNVPIIASKQYISSEIIKLVVMEFATLIQPNVFAIKGSMVLRVNTNRVQIIAVIDLINDRWKRSVSLKLKMLV